MAHCQSTQLNEKNYQVNLLFLIEFMISLAKISKRYFISLGFKNTAGRVRAENIKSFLTDNF